MTTLFDELNLLVKEGLVRRKDYDDGLCIFKYKPQVHWKNLWNVSPALLRARGIVFRKDGLQINDPLPKLFYLGENGTKVDRDKIVLAERKVNGFYANVFLHNGQRRVSTTGTLDSDYVKMAEELLSQVSLGHYEVVHPNDPHIIPELPGVYSLGIDEHGDNRPEILTARLSDIVNFTKKVKHEGFVIYDPKTLRPLCKIKSPYYLGLKLMARMKEVKITEDMARDTLRTRMDEEYYPLIDHIYDVYGVHKFAAMQEQERLEMMRDFLDRETLNNERLLYE